MSHYVYIMSNKAHRMYTGYTAVIERRAFEHKNQLSYGFTKQYRFDRLVYFETYSTEMRARTRERQIIRMDAREEDRAHRVGQSVAA